MKCWARDVCVIWVCITIQIILSFCGLGPFKYKAQEISSMDLDKEEDDVQEDEDEAEVGVQP